MPLATAAAVFAVSAAAVLDRDGSIRSMLMSRGGHKAMKDVGGMILLVGEGSFTLHKTANVNTDVYDSSPHHTFHCPLKSSKPQKFNHLVRVLCVHQVPFCFSEARPEARTGR